MQTPIRTLYSRQHQGHMVAVIEDAECRILTFNSRLTQSRMSLADPLVLLLPYTRCMMAALLFVPQPARILMIGLGGGSMAKFLLHHFPLCRMDVVEEDVAMPALARTFFFLPDDPRLTLFLEDGARFMERVASQTGAGCYDLILVDAYDQVGMAQSVYAERFLAHAARLLTPHGVVAINLIRTDAEMFRALIGVIQRQFVSGVLQLPVLGSNNEIFFVGPGIALWEDRRLMEMHAWELESRLALHGSIFLQDLTRLVVARRWRDWLGWR